MLFLFLSRLCLCLVRLSHSLSAFVCLRATGVGFARRQRASSCQVHCSRAWSFSSVPIVCNACKSLVQYRAAHSYPGSCVSPAPRRLQQPDLEPEVRPVSDCQDFRRKINQRKHEPNPQNTRFGSKGAAADRNVPKEGVVHAEARKGREEVRSETESHEILKGVLDHPSTPEALPWAELTGDGRLN